MSDALRVDSQRFGDAAVVSVQGEIDLSTAAEVEAALDASREGVRALALDLRGVGFIDTSGLRLVFEERQRAKQRGYRFAVVRGSPHVQRVFEIAGFADADGLFVDDPSEVAGTGDP
jgi:anti-sigma B factor antagonist